MRASFPGFIAAGLLSGLLLAASGCAEYRYANYPRGCSEFIPECMRVYRSFGVLQGGARKSCESACRRGGPDRHRRFLQNLGVWEKGQTIHRDAAPPPQCREEWDWCLNELLHDAGMGRSLQDSRRICRTLCTNYGFKTGHSILRAVFLESRRAPR